jgi:hypothetical protein
MIFNIEPSGLPTKTIEDSTPPNAIGAYFRDNDLSDKISDGKMILETTVTIDGKSTNYETYIKDRGCQLVMAVATKPPKSFHLHYRFEGCESYL